MIAWKIISRFQWNFVSFHIDKFLLCNVGHHLVTSFGPYWCLFVHHTSVTAWYLEKKKVQCILIKFCKLFHWQVYTWNSSTLFLDKFSGSFTHAALVSQQSLDCRLINNECTCIKMKFCKVFYIDKFWIWSIAQHFAKGFLKIMALAFAHLSITFGFHMITWNAIVGGMDFDEILCNFHVDKFLLGILSCHFVTSFQADMTLAYILLSILLLFLLSTSRLNKVEAQWNLWEVTYGQVQIFKLFDYDKILPEVVTDHFVTSFLGMLDFAYIFLPTTPVPLFLVKTWKMLC